MQDSAHIKNLGWRRGIGIASNVQVVVVLRNVFQGDDFGIPLDLGVVIKRAYDLVDVLLA